MLLAVDVGNTSTKFGLFAKDELLDKFAVPTHSTDLVGDINGRLDGGFDQAIVCSVVPDAAERLHRLILNGFGISPTFVKSDIDLGIKVMHEPVATLGPDRLVNSFAAVNIYGTPVIVVSLGTATTIDVVDQDRMLQGGLIAPGVTLMARSLKEHTAKLPEVDVTSPDEILGRNTEDAIRSGVYLSAVGFLETAVAKILDEVGGDARVVATGGFAEMIEADTPCIDVVDENLTLYGLNLIANRNKSASTSVPS
jgi:type III pantothenate kinase